MPHAVNMRRSTTNSAFWGISVTIQVPTNMKAFEYKYLARDVDGQLWAESGPARLLDLTGSALAAQRRMWSLDGASETALEKEDTFATGVTISG